MSALPATSFGLMMNLPTPAADQAPLPPAATIGNQADDLNLDEIVVTAIPGNASSKFESSVSVSTLTPDEIAQSDPSSAADIVRNIPGFRSQASGGEGNANISARGLHDFDYGSSLSRATGYESVNNSFWIRP
jgi:outer membrane receptor protein involved in Fe transport